MVSALDLIERKESGGKNVPNYKYGPGFSASGHFQMINATWQRWAKAAGIDISQYPRAIDAPYEVQRQVAAHGFKTEGFKPWEATKDLVGQEANYTAGDGGALASTGTAPSPAAPARPSAYQTAQGMIGLNETANTAQLAKFMGDQGIPITPNNVAWCAAFVNASWKASARRALGSLAARSFMKWGQPTDAPNEGDVAVFSRGSDPTKGHVGFYGGRETRDGQDYIKVLAGNQGGKAAGGGGVNYAYLPASQLLGYRTSGQAAPQGTLAAGGTPAAPTAQAAAEPMVTTFETPDAAFQKGLASVQAKQQQQAPAPVQQAAAPAPAPAPAAPGQMQASDLMSSLLAMKRARYAQPQGVLDTSWV
jgi:uncharacterized protein (TIGR02594 family)